MPWTAPIAVRLLRRPVKHRMVVDNRLQELEYGRCDERVRPNAIDDVDSPRPQRWVRIKCVPLRFDAVVGEQDSVRNPRTARRTGVVGDGMPSAHRPERYPTVLDRRALVGAIEPGHQFFDVVGEPNAEPALCPGDFVRGCTAVSSAAEEFAHPFDFDWHESWLTRSNPRSRPSGR